MFGRVRQVFSRVGSTGSLRWVVAHVPSGEEGWTARWQLTPNPVALWWQPMASITLKDIPDDLHARLKQEGEANFRSMAQEVLARLEQTFAMDDQLNTQTVNRLIDESFASGPEEKFSRAKFDAAIAAARSRHAAKGKAR